MERLDGWVKVLIDEMDEQTNENWQCMTIIPNPLKKIILPLKNCC